jgi:hypothetical protein
MKETTILFGPFVGSMIWELKYFVPHLIYLKRNRPDKKFIILTRKERFDFYGKYVDILVPLNLSDKGSIGFKNEKLSLSEYRQLIIRYNLLYSRKYNIENHIYPRLDFGKEFFRWQIASKYEMNYYFLPRKNNLKLVNSFLDGKKYDRIVDLTWVENYSENCFIFNNFDFEKFHNFLFLDDAINWYLKINKTNTDTTLFGFLIYLMKTIGCISGNLKSIYTQMGMIIPNVEIELLNNGVNQEKMLNYNILNKKIKDIK